MRDLTVELGIGAPSLYSAFGSKQQLFTDAIRVYDRQYGGFIEAALDRVSQQSPCRPGPVRADPA